MEDNDSSTDDASSEADRSNMMTKEVYSLVRNKVSNVKKRAACHRCGNMRRSPNACINKNCPQVFCKKCTVRLIELHGESCFRGGCPVCLHQCCCSTKSLTCDREFHCYRKCPASKSAVKDKPPAIVRQKPVIKHSKGKRSSAKFPDTVHADPNSFTRIAAVSQHATRSKRIRESSANEEASLLLLSLRNDAEFQTVTDAASSPLNDESPVVKQKRSSTFASSDMSSNAMLLAQLCAESLPIVTSTRVTQGSKRQYQRQGMKSHIEDTIDFITSNGGYSSQSAPPPAMSSSIEQLRTLNKPTAYSMNDGHSLLYLADDEEVAWNDRRRPYRDWNSAMNQISD